MKITTMIVWVSIALCSGALAADQGPFSFTETLAIERLHTAPPAAFASPSSPHVLLIESAGAYWLLNTSIGENKKIAKDDFGGAEGSVSAVMWGETKLAIFYSHAEIIKLLDPENPHDPLQGVYW